MVSLNETGPEEVLGFGLALGVTQRSGKKWLLSCVGNFFSEHNALLCKISNKDFRWNIHIQFRLVVRSLLFIFHGNFQVSWEHFFKDWLIDMAGGMAERGRNIGERSPIFFHPQCPQCQDHLLGFPRVWQTREPGPLSPAYWGCVVRSCSGNMKHPGLKSALNLMLCAGLNWKQYK